MALRGSLFESRCTTGGYNGCWFSCAMVPGRARGAGLRSVAIAKAHAIIVKNSAGK